MSDGPDLLKAYLAKHGLSAAEFSRRSGVAEAHISRYIGRKRVPGLEHATAIEDATAGAVPSKSWLATRSKKTRSSSKAA